MSPSNESLIEKKKKQKKNKRERERERKEPKSMTKVMGQSNLRKPQSKKGQKENSTRNNQETRVKESQTESPKNGMRKIQEMDSNWGYSQAWEETKKILDEV